MRSTFWIFGVVAVGTAVACSGGDPGEIHFSVPWDSGPTGITPTPGFDASTGPGTPKDAGTQTPVDAAPPNPFEGSSYASNKPTKSAKEAHAATSKQTKDLDQEPYTDCIDCHQSTATAGDKPFFSAGVAYEDRAATKRIADAEILMVDANGKRIKTNTDSDGFFWFPSSVANGLVGPLYVGIRSPDGTTQKMMASVILPTQRSCNVGGCHNKTTAQQGAGYIFAKP